MRISSLAALVAMFMTIGLAGASGTDGAAWYIVRLSDAPAATYRGGILGLAATDAHATGRRHLDTAAPATRAYVGYLGQRHVELLESAHKTLGHKLTPRFQYHYALNGMSVRLTPVEAAAMARLPGVISVQPVHYYKPTTAIPASAADTDFSRAWVNAPGAWQLNTDTEGEGIVVADVDTGINSGNSSFAATGPKDGYVTVNPLGSGHFLGVCPASATFHCNDKLIGAYSYTPHGNDPHSPEDSEGHGSHTASIAAGNFVDAATSFGSAPISGIAPHANIIMYDVCDPTDLCGQDASVQAVDQAIQDQSAIVAAHTGSFKGMVMNFSIGGGEDPYNDPVEQAFLNAVEAGIYVSASGGNGGPVNAIANDPVGNPQYPVEHRGPWVASTAASTHDGIISNLLENFAGGDATTLAALPANMVGVSATGGSLLRTIVYAGYSEYQGADPVKTGTAHTSQQPYPLSLGPAQDAAQCLYPFATGTFIGKLVVCDRGTIALVDKAYNVQQGGAVGIVIATTSTSSQDLVAETYVIPGTLIDSADRTLLLGWLNHSTHPGGNTKASISAPALTSDPSRADQLAGFSSRGPTNTSYDDLVKPDLTAPGVTVLAAFNDPGFADGCTSCASTHPETYAFLDGTSMASPHDTGSAALLMQLHPGWSPAELKSALMLTAVTTSLTDQCASLDAGQNCVVSSEIPSPQVRGSGRIDVEAASRVGFVLDETGNNYEAVASGRNGDTLTTLNLASLGNDACGGGCSWTRTLTSAFNSASVVYNVSVTGATSGLQVSVAPNPQFTLPAKNTRTLTIQADTSNVPSGKWAFAEVDITTTDTGDGGITVADMHIPVAVRAIVSSAHMRVKPTELDFTLQAGASSSTSLNISNDGQLSLHWSLEAANGTSCGNTGMNGLSLNPASGTVAAGKNGVVAAKFDAGRLAAGRYTGMVCVNSDASDHPLQVIPVVVTVKDAPSSAGSGSGGGGGGGGSGGGGSEGLLALAALSLFLRWRP